MIEFQGFAPPYASSSKQPDQCILPIGQKLPTVVIESGWTESFLDLHRDRDLWLKGGAGDVQIVLLFKWSKLASGVNGVVELWNLDQAGNENRLQREVIN